uniref:HEPN domain-containing protein n=1 Tax=Meloidogyne hapla TaxID=6305 RepID=A0A1I8BSH0_MELHA
MCFLELVPVVKRAKSMFFHDFKKLDSILKETAILRDCHYIRGITSHQLNIFLKHQKDLVDRAIELGYKKILYALDICTTTVFVDNEINCEDLRNKAFELLKIANIKFVNSVERAKGIRLSTSSKNFQRLKLAVELLSKVKDINKDLEIIKEQAKYALEFCSNVGVLYEEAEDIEYLKKYCEETVNVKANELLESVGIQFIIPG